MLQIQNAQDESKSINSEYQVQNNKPVQNLTSVEHIFPHWDSNSRPQACKLANHYIMS